MLLARNGRDRIVRLTLGASCSRARRNGPARAPSSMADFTCRRRATPNVRQQTRLAERLREIGCKQVSKGSLSPET